MSKINSINSKDALHAIVNGEFPDSVIKASQFVAVIMAQDWCSQWQFMKQWLAELQLPQNAVVFTYIYNLDVHFKKFLALKEGAWQNTMIPYIRFYKDGILTATTNYLSKDEFLKLLAPE